MPISSTQEIIEELRNGHMVILVDDEDRENEGDLMIAADFITPESINFMAHHARGLICLTITQQRADQLGLFPMAKENHSAFNTAFTTSIEAADGVTTGISAFDRAKTIQVAVSRTAQATDIVQPGHVFPIIAKQGGVLRRAGHTEAGCDLTAMAGLTSAAVICEIMNEDGSMARLPQLLSFAEKHNLKIGTIADLISYRNRHESIVYRVAENIVSTIAGKFKAIVYKDKPNQSTHIALVKGNITPDVETLVRVHQPLSLMDFLDCKTHEHSWNLIDALHTIDRSERGILVMLNYNEQQDDFLAKFAEINQPQTPSVSTAKSQILRNYGIGAQILCDLGVGKMKLMANPKKLPSMAGYNLDITGYQEHPTY